MCGQDREEPGPQRRPDKADTDRQAAGTCLQKVTSALEWGDGAMAPALSMIVSDASTRVITVPFSVVKGWHAPAGRRSVKPRPLAQARQIGPAAPAGARIGPVRRASLKTTPTASGQMAGYTGSRPADVTLVRLPVDAEAR
jgi:hypothetical protein